MKVIVPGHYVVMQPYLSGGGQVRLRCRKCWNQWEIDLPRLPKPENHDTLSGKCPQCNTSQTYEAHSQAGR